jgi:hypothetical protein
MLVLPIKKKWFDMILLKEKTEEYRDITPYYMARFKSIFGMFPYSYIPLGMDKQSLILRNGYSKKSPSCIITASLNIGKGRPEWGAEKDKEYYVLRIHSVEPVSS